MHFDDLENGIWNIAPLYFHWRIDIPAWFAYFDLSNGRDRIKTENAMNEFYFVSNRKSSQSFFELIELNIEFYVA